MRRDAVIRTPQMTGCVIIVIMIRRLHDEPTRRRFTRTDYRRMAEVGILAEDDRVELLDGEITIMSPIGIPHSAAVRFLNSFFSARVGKRAIVDVQNPIAIGDANEPQPDLTILRPSEDYYRKEHPGPADVLLLIEVADTSRELDRGEKLRLYAQAGIAEYWVIDLNRRLLIVHRKPKHAEYASVQQYDGDARVAPEALADVELAIGSLFGSQ